MTYSTLKVLHILILACWLGLEMAVFLLFSKHRDYDIPIEGRRALHEVHEPIAFGPRVFWMPMLAVGIALANVGHWGFTGTAGEVFAIAGGAVAAAWTAGSAYVFHSRRTGRWRSDDRVARNVGIIERIDTGLRYLIVVGLVVVGVTSLAGDGLIAVDWLAWKVIVVAVLVAVTLAWRRLGRRIAIERRRVVGIDKSREPDHAAFRVMTYQAQTLLATFWVLMIVIVWLAVDKPV